MKPKLVLSMPQDKVIKTMQSKPEQKFWHLWQLHPAQRKTLEALERKGLVELGVRGGWSYCWRLTEIGQEAAS